MLFVCTRYTCRSYIADLVHAAERALAGTANSWYEASAAVTDVDSGAKQHPCNLRHRLHQEGVPRFGIEHVGVSRAQILFPQGLSSVGSASVHGAPQSFARLYSQCLRPSKVFPREITLTLVKDRSILNTAVAEGFLLVLEKSVTLNTTQATDFCKMDEFGTTPDKASALIDTPLIGALLEKPFAVESWLSMPSSNEAVHSSLSPTAATVEAIALFGEPAVQSLEYTFAFVKPDVFEKHAPSILAVAEANGFTIVCSKALTLTKEQVRSACAGFALSPRASPTLFSCAPLRRKVSLRMRRTVLHLAHLSS